MIIFKRNHFELDWQEIVILQNPFDPYTNFLEQFLTSYDSFFPMKKSR